MNGEYNFVTDPEAAHKVFKKFKNIHLVPWECCPEFEIPKDKYDLMCDPSFPKTDFVGKSHHHQVKRKGYMYICDGFTSLIAIDPTLCEYTADLQGKVFIDGEAAGQISYYWPGYTNKYDPTKVNCRVYRNFKIEETMDLVIDCLRK